MSDPYDGTTAGQGGWQPPEPPAQFGDFQHPPGWQQYPPFPPAQQYHPVPQPVPPGYGYVNQVVIAQAPTNGVGVAGFVCGLLGLILCWVPVLGLVLGVLGVILGGIGIGIGRKSGAGTGLAVAGLVLGIISLVPAILVIAALAD